MTNDQWTNQSHRSPTTIKVGCPRYDTSELKVFPAIVSAYEVDHVGRRKIADHEAGLLMHIDTHASASWHNMHVVHVHVRERARARLVARVQMGMSVYKSMPQIAHACIITLVLRQE